MHRFWPVVAELLEVIDARRICEVGADDASHTRLLIEYCAERAAFLEVVATQPALDVEAWQARYPAAWRLHRQPSVEALPGIPLCDVYLLNGNPHRPTLARELALISNLAEAGSTPCVLVRDDRTRSAVEEHLAGPGSEQLPVHLPLWSGLTLLVPRPRLGTHVQLAQLVEKVRGVSAFDLVGGLERARLAGHDLPSTPLLLPTSAEPSPGELHGEAVDVIVTVHGALDYVRLCLESLRRHRDGFAVRVIVVDDGSGPATAAWFKDVAAIWPELTVVEHERNLGYTRAVNSGLRASSAPWVVLLNSDTVVTEGWLAKMVRCARSDPTLGIVGPLSNAASWQSVPLVLDQSGRFAVNELTDGLDANGMARLVASVAERAYPRVPVLNGCCMLLRRAVIDQVGEMDAVLFPVGYGEENDYCLRAAQAGFTLAVADDAYVFHAKSRSFGERKRVELSRRGGSALAAKYGESRVASLSQELKDHPGLDAARSRVEMALAARREALRLEAAAGVRVLFLLPVPGQSGGANSVMQEAAEMASLGVLVRIAVPPQYLGELAALYAEIPGVRQLLMAAPLDQLVEVSKDFDVVVATVYYTMEWVFRIAAGNPGILPAYYVQDYEPLFFTAGSAEHAAAAASYARVPGALLFAKTHWIARTVHEAHGVQVRKVEPSIDHGTFHPTEPRRAGAAVRVTAMVRPQTPRRGAARTMRLLRELSRRHADRVEIHVFGCETTDERFAPLVRDFPFQNHGLLRRPEVAELLRQSDLFIDLSDYQAFGRTALEAMASGCVAVVPRAGGAEEFAVDGLNALVVDTADELSCLAAVDGLLQAPADLRRMRPAALAAAARFTVHGAALSELHVMSTAARQWRHGRSLPRRKRLVLARVGSAGPSRLGTGAVAGWKVPSVQRAWRVVERDALPEPGSAELAVLVVSPGSVDWSVLHSWLEQWRGAGGRSVIHLELAEPSASAATAPAAYHPKLIEAIRWLADSADVICVSTPELQRRLAALGVDAVSVPPALDPITWRLGPAGRRLVDRAGPTPPTRIGILSGPIPNGPLRALEQLADEGERFVVEVLEPHGTVPAQFKKLAVPKLRREAELVDWLLDHARWDIGLSPVPAAASSDCEHDLSRMQLSALGAAIVSCDANDSAAWRSAIATLLHDRAERERLAAVARRSTDERLERLDLELAAANLLERAMSMPVSGEVPELPRALRGLVGGVFPRLQKRYVAVPEAKTSFPTPRSKLSRKLDKLRRDPARFFGDSKVRPLRVLKGWFG